MIGPVVPGPDSVRYPCQPQAVAWDPLPAHPRPAFTGQAFRRDSYSPKRQEATSKGGEKLRMMVGKEQERPGGAQTKGSKKQIPRLELGADSTLEHTPGKRDHLRRWNPMSPAGCSPEHSMVVVADRHADRAGRGKEQAFGVVIDLESWMRRVKLLRRGLSAQLGNRPAWGGGGWGLAEERRSGWENGDVRSGAGPTVQPGTAFLG
ncbi:hypothetical protein Cadr_000018104 [Camelus dromedarius]|uniref:Uncharacterized protein n=1 Tax=Camelus dromedarius TaxID=9838 RepID=A0A5N4D6M7_CAMDR|nr:hypothetical protein Cadr_000018104 [Camelus dromedarius]